MTNTNGLPTGTNFKLISLNASVAPTLHMVKDAPTSTTLTIAPNVNHSLESLLTAISTKLTELEHLTGLLNQCNRDIAERLKV